MTDTEAAFLRTISEHKDADAPREIYADWLAEQGRDAQAEFIKIQCELARTKKEPCCDANGNTIEGDERRMKVIPCPYCEWSVLHRRERELWHRIGNDLFQSLGIDFAPFTTIKDSLMSAASARTGYILHGKNGSGNVELIWNRGFLHTVRAPSAIVLGKAGIAAALGRLPGLERVELSDKKPAEWTMENPRDASGGFVWVIRSDNQIPADHDIPRHLFNLLKGGRKNKDNWACRYDSAQAALDALAVAVAQFCVQQAREKVTA